MCLDTHSWKANEGAGFETSLADSSCDGQKILVSLIRFKTAG